ncbi:diaminopimelate epimerase [Haloarcula nitratireducens]|uniref:Diaminopimelate epimerase n=1 Tax=Haloarcula nitratireducens TaxID=2487749 RepID=A0AAW4PF88_9EURY|nr:diaminopimelate epimerase [Halomicroarcula nitratireducens]MBX0296504.1 diaminopimelate epimerase [Halomicroarcula nitratireducens]
MVRISKWNGTGNEFVIVGDAADIEDRVAFTKAICDRASGLAHPKTDVQGADGVLFLSVNQGTPPRVEMQHVQPDGSMPDMCGNGVRCAAKWASTELDTRTIVVDTGAGPHPAEVNGHSVEVRMQELSFAPSDIPLRTANPLIAEAINGVSVTAVTTGVPHAVAFVEDVHAVDLSAIAPPIRYADVFPEGANVTIAHEGPDNNRYCQRTFERGVEGETAACGTGAIAIAAAAIKTGRTQAGTELTIAPPGGELTVQTGGERTTLTGPVKHEFDTTLDSDSSEFAVSP